MKGDFGHLSLKRIDYMASRGREVFLSYETPEGKIAGFLRLRNISGSLAIPMSDLTWVKGYSSH